MDELETLFDEILADVQQVSAPKVAKNFRARQDNQGTGTVILLDLSDSMNEPVSKTETRLDRLKLALKEIPKVDDMHFIAFYNGDAHRVNPLRLPFACGNTPLEQGLRLAAKLNPKLTIVISDGEPNLLDLALHEARKLPGFINTIFCGGEDGVGHIFLKKLAKVGSGTYQEADLRNTRALPNSIYKALGRG